VALSTARERTVIAGRYDILGLIGAGGMGCVYRAHDSKLDEIVALKMLSRELADTPGMLARFTQEVKLARKVTHKNVARTYDLGEDNGVHFLTMELIDGEPLSAKIARGGRLPLSESIDIACAVSEGLAAAHAAGVVHRDLKPDNVLIAKDGRVVLTDFGIARALEQVGTRTMGGPVGTPAYMAPEQVEASPDVDARADQYALGVMLYEMVTGSLPWNGSSPYAIAAARLVHPPPDPRAVRPDLPESIAAVIMRCMAREPRDRLATIAEVATRLAGVTLPATSIPAPARSTPIITDSVGVGTKAVAVLPLRNGSGPENDYLAEGLTDDLIDSLSMTPGLRVRPRSVVMNVRAESRDPRDVGRELGVQVVVEGSVRIAGDIARINVRLLGVVDGFQLWAKRFDVPKGDVLRAADEAATAIAEALTVDKQERPVVTDAQAVDLYLRGRSEYYKFDVDAVARAIDLFDKAVAIRQDDPRILSAFAAACARQLNFQGEGPTSNFYARAREAAVRALQLAPSLPDAHFAMGVVELHTGDAAAASLHTRRALELNPDHGDAHDLAARILLETGPREACERHVARAIAAEPRLVALPYMLARYDALEGNWDRVRQIMAKQPPDFLRAFYWTLQARLFLWSHDKQGAAQAKPIVAAIDMVRRDVILMLFALIENDGASAEAMLGHLPRAMRGRLGAFFAQIGAEIAAFGGLDERALDFVGQSVGRGLFDIVWLDRCPLLERLRASAEWADLRAEVAARAARVRQPLAGRNA
jgi:serine/threonine-protein kinase